MMRLRSAFSMIVAIFVIVMLSIVASYIFYASSSVAKEGDIQYKREQAMLLARSYTEYAVLAIMGNGDRNNTANNYCLTNINAIIGNSQADVNSGLGYQVDVVITYIGDSKYLSNRCVDANNINRIAAQSPAVQTDSLSAIIDVYVRYKDWSNNALNGANAVNAANVPWQTYHRRSIQKI